MGVLLIIPHGHSFQEVEGSAVYRSTGLCCDCALDRLYLSRGWKSYSAPEPADQVVELNRCICMGKQIVSVLYKALLPHQKWFPSDTWKTEGAARPLKGWERHSYEIETQPNTRWRSSHLSRTFHSSRKGNLEFSRCLYRKEEEIRPRKYYSHQNFRGEGYVSLYTMPYSNTWLEFNLVFPVIQ